MARGASVAGRGGSVRFMGIARRFAAEARASLGDAVSRIVLFGSAARGTAGRGSDIDVLVVARADRYEARRRLVELSFRHLLDDGVYISVKVLTPEDVEGLRALGSGFLRNVEREGVELG